ncbi:mamu class II histocompatibility antigen, DR alpha chain-like [Loxodonta africana]|uniref:mamu class II histocompatibility antigen, DR alpha chain-like n=1 Tax=Loxodonta africana TaxID=9785 RepID=UPI0030D0ADE6
MKTMARSGVLVLVFFTVAVLMSSHQSWATKEEHVTTHAELYLSPNQSGEFMLDFDGDEIFHVNMEKKETAWWLKGFECFASFEAQSALANIAADKANLDVMMKRFSCTLNINESPEETLLLNSPAEFLQPYILISFVDTFSPPMLKVTRLKNGKPVITGVSETVFLPREDHFFCKFYYLPFLPSTEDFCDCQVDHWGLDKLLLKHWGMNHPSILKCQIPPRDNSESGVCILGLVVGVVGIIVATIFIIKGV